MAPQMGRQVATPYMQPFAGQVPAGSPGWRCVHGAVNPPPSTPELCLADEQGFAIVVQWPSVNHATAYVVELRESGSQQAERFMRSVPAQALGSLVELRIGGLRPGTPGQCFVAQIRCIAPCGCESDASPPGMSQPFSLPVAATQHTPAMPPGTLHTSVPAHVAAASPVPKPVGIVKLEQEKIGAPFASRSMPTTSEGYRKELPTLLSPSSRLPLPHPATANWIEDAQKGALADADDDCIILD